MIKGVLIDLGGVLYVDGEVLPGAVDAVRALRNAGVPFRFVTNTSRRTRRGLVEKLAGMGIEATAEMLFTAPLAVRRHLEEHRLRPFLIIHPDLEEEFEGLPLNEPNAVVLGDAGAAFDYERLNRAFRLLTKGAPLLSVGMNRYFREPDGLSLDVGPFVRALEFAARTEALVLGKPSSAFFLEAVAALGCQPGETVMVGDDAESDVGGALAAGLRGILVQTGKYQPGDESTMGEGASVVTDICVAVERILREV